MFNIKDVANKLNIKEDDLILYGNYMAKVNTNIDNKDSKLVLVTAITPTKYGEGKTTISIGLNDALWKLGKKSVACLREPSLGPVFGLKGGACGGGKAKIVPEDNINMQENLENFEKKFEEIIPKYAFYWRFSCYYFS